MLEEMTKARVFCPHDRVPKVIDALYDFGAIHITRSREAVPDLPLAHFDRVAKALIALRAAERALGIKPSAGLEGTKLEPLEKLLAEASALEKELARVYEAEKRALEARSQATSLRTRLAELEPFVPLEVPPSYFRKQSRASLLYFKLISGENDFCKQAESLGCDAGIVRSGKKGVYGLVAADAAKAPGVEGEMAKHGLRLSVPETAEDSFAKEHSACSRQLRELEAECAKHAEFVKEFGQKNGPRLSQVRLELEEHARKAELPSKFGRSDFVEIIEGWVPQKRFSELEHLLAVAASKKIAVEHAGTSEEPPVLLVNPPLLRRFEFLVRFFSLPNSGEIDPTMVIALTFPLFFGMILGDVGYGLMTLLLALAIRFKLKGEFAQDLSGMLFLSGAVATAFGFVYGEFFGGEDMLGVELHPAIHRSAHGIELLIGVVLLVALLHIALGLLIGAYSNFVHGHVRHAYAKLAWLVLEFSLAAAAGSLLVPNIFPPAYSAVYTGFVIASVAGLYYFEGITALVEIPSIIANTLSYLRIMALGLSGVILSQVVNQLPVRQSFEALSLALSHGASVVAIASAILSLLFFGLLLVVGHAGALALGIFESGLHTLRLHYVEFFSKFYSGGGKPFSPLRKTMR